MSELTAIVEWRGGKAFKATSGSGHSIVIDGAREKGPQPMECLLMGMGACASVDVVLILERMRESVAGCRADLRAERAETDPKVFTRIHVHFVVTGENLSDAKVARAVSLSAEKYCSASIMLGKTAEITHDFEIASAAS